MVRNQQFSAKHFENLSFVNCRSGARKLMGENLKVVWAEFFTLSLSGFVISVIEWHRQACSDLLGKTRPRFCPVCHGQTSVSRTKSGPSFQLQKQLHVCFSLVLLLSKMAHLKVENSTYTTFRFSPVRFHPPRLHLYRIFCSFEKKALCQLIH